MKPITKGYGEDTFSLYYPLRFPKELLSIKIEPFIAHLYVILPKGIIIEIIEESEKKGIEIFKLSEIKTYDQAIAIFDHLNLFFLRISIENDIAIFSYNEISTYKKTDLCFPDGWQPGAKAGWIAEENGLIRIDGVATIVYPVIVPEKKRIVDSGTFMFGGKRLINFESIEKAGKFTFEKIADNKTLLAAKSYINVFSHSNLVLQFLGLVICLELLANQKEKGEAFNNMVKSSLEKINLVQTNNDQECKAIEQIKSLLGKLTRQSISEALETLIADYKNIISISLPVEHPYRDNPISAVKEIYKVRSKIAHSGSLGSMKYDKFQWAMQFVKVSAKSIIKDRLTQ